MSLRIVYGRSGSGKSQFCFDEIKEKISIEDKIFMITPEQFSFTAEQKLLETIGSGSSINAEVISFRRIAHRVLQEVGGISAKMLYHQRQRL